VKRHIPLMPHEERRKLIEAPFITTHIPGKSWAGVLIDRDLPEDRTISGWHPRPWRWDEELFGYARDVVADTYDEEGFEL